MWITPTSVCTQFVLLNAELLTENWKHIIPILQNILKVVKVLLLIWSWRTLAKSFILNYTCTCVELTVYTATTFSAETVELFVGFMGSLCTLCEVGKREENHLPPHSGGRLHIDFDECFTESFAALLRAWAKLNLIWIFEKFFCLLNGNQHLVKLSSLTAS